MSECNNDLNKSKNNILHDITIGILNHCDFSDIQNLDDLIEEYCDTYASIYNYLLENFDPKKQKPEINFNIIKSPTDENIKITRSEEIIED